MAEFLLELLSEEIPARMQVKAAENLKRLFTESLNSANLTFTHSEAHVTPRRLTLMVDGLPLHQPDTIEERKGPKLGSPEQAIQGFLKGSGLKTLEEAEQRQTDKGVFWYAIAKKSGRPTAEVLPEIVGTLLTQFPWPKSMRWSEYPLIWVRPLHSILMVLNGIGLTDSLEFGGLTFTGTNTTVGHRFLAPDRFEVHNYTHYSESLRTHKVIVGRQVRRQEIFNALAAAAANEGLDIVEDDALLEEVTGLVEWPVIYLGSIDKDYMDLPPEVRATTMRANQKYFTLQHKDGTPAPRFALIGNIPGNDGGKAIIAGNERVLRARLSDARFFWDLDLKTTLEERLPALEAITFHAKLGTLKDKIDRLTQLAAFIAPYAGCPPEAASLAARLSKCDLVSGMVGEFPELQGIMGRYYALNEGHSPEIANAIAQHYSPLGPGDSCPSAPVSIAVALADKLDTLVGFFAVGELPTGSRDPFALRRAALGIIRLILSNKIEVSLTSLIEKAASLHKKPIDAKSIFDFIADRLKVSLRDQGTRHDYIDAVLGTGSDNNLGRVMTRVQALETFLASEAGISLLAAYRRGNNILDIEQKKDSIAYTPDFNPGLLTEPAEKELGKLLQSSQEQALVLTREGKFADSMALLAKLRTPLDNFFEMVRVNDTDAELRRNRLSLLRALTNTFNAIADFSRIEGG